MCASDRYLENPRQAAHGRVKSTDPDLSTSRENTEADVGLVQSYAGTRPVASVRLFRLQSLEIDKSGRWLAASICSEALNAKQDAPRSRRHLRSRLR